MPTHPRLRSARNTLLWFAACMAYLIVVYTLTVSLLPASEPAPSWTATSGKPAPLDFRFAMFPAGKIVALRDAPEITALSTNLLERALVNTLEEAKVSPVAWVAVQQPNQQLWVRRSDIAFTPAPDADRQALFDAYLANDDKRHPGVFHHGSLVSAPSPDGSTRYTLHISDDDHKQTFIYDVNGATATPVAEYRVFGPAVALSNLSNNVIGVAVAAAALLAASAGYRIVRRRTAARAAAAAVDRAA